MRSGTASWVLLVAMVVVVVALEARAALHLGPAPVEIPSTSGSKLFLLLTCCQDAGANGCDGGTTYSTRCIASDWTAPVSCAGSSRIELYAEPDGITDTNTFSTNYELYGCFPPPTGVFGGGDPSTHIDCYEVTALMTGDLTTGDSDGAPSRNLRGALSAYTVPPVFVARVTADVAGFDDSRLYLHCAQ